jgi:hypothetical protein
VAVVYLFDTYTVRNSSCSIPFFSLSFHRAGMFRPGKDENCIPIHSGFVGVPLFDRVCFVEELVRAWRDRSAAKFYECAPADAGATYIGSQSKQPKYSEFYHRECLHSYTGIADAAPFPADF